jgi:hypothetical protein
LEEETMSGQIFDGFVRLAAGAPHRRSILRALSATALAALGLSSRAEPGGAFDLEDCLDKCARSGGDTIDCVCDCRAEDVFQKKKKKCQGKEGTAKRRCLDEAEDDADDEFEECTEDDAFRASRS